MKNERDGNQRQKSTDEKTLSKSEIKEYLKKLPGWKIVHEDSADKLTHEYSFDNFSEVLEFTDSIERLAKVNNHHPVLKSSWAKVDIYWWTHTQADVQEQDFQMALESDTVYSKIMKSNE